MRSLAVPSYLEFRVGLPDARVGAAIAAHRADLVHLGSPFALGASAAAAARHQGRPMVAVYATDVPGYARAYHAGRAAAVARLAASPALRAGLGSAGRQVVLSRGWPALCTELMTHYRAVLDAADAVRAGVAA
jgi:hypothetical protein